MADVVLSGEEGDIGSLSGYMSNYGGTDNYEDLSNKPKINGVVLVGDKTFADLGYYGEIEVEDI